MTRNDDGNFDRGRMLGERSNDLGDADEIRPHASENIRSHPRRWTVAAGGLAAVLALGGYGVAQVATSHGGDHNAISTAAAMTPSGAPPSGAGARGGQGGPGPGTFGTVVAFTDNEITLRGRGKSVTTVAVTSTTVYKNGSTTVTSSAIKKGEFVMVTGTTSNGTVMATTVTVGTLPTRGSGKRGTPPGSPEAA